MSTMPRRTSPTSAPRRDGRHAELRGTARERLLDAALAELREGGYGGTSLEAIARRAGLTRGAVYWNFHSKLELFLALLEERVDRPARELMRMTETAPAETPTAGAVSHGLARLVRDQGDLIMLLFEYWALAVRDPNLRPAFNERQRLLRNALARALEARHAATGVALSYPAERLATAVLALANGLAMTALADPDTVSDQLLGEVLDLLYDGLAARARAGER
jgi:AcrR family transcriptional regulator